MTLLVITPLQEELDALTDALRLYGLASAPGQIGRLPVVTFATFNLVVARGGHGKTQFGVQTQHLLEHTPNVAAVLCCGAAGALAEKLTVGDLIIATETVEHDFTTLFVRRPPPRFAGDAALLAQLQRLPGDTLPFRVFFGTVASGDEDVVALERAAALRQATEAMAVAWEGAGGARACAFNGVPFIELRGITDTANHDAPADFKTNLGLAMANIATFVRLWREH